MNDERLHPIVPHLRLRCHARAEDDSVAFCGRAAIRHRPARPPAPHAYYCAAHAAASDQPLPFEPLARIVQVTFRVTLAGVAQLPIAAQNEAVLAVEAALAALGGLVDVQAVTSRMAWIAPLNRAGRPIGSGGEG